MKLLRKGKLDIEPFLSIYQKSYLWGELCGEGRIQWTKKEWCFEEAFRKTSVPYADE